MFQLSHHISEIACGHTTAAVSRCCLLSILGAQAGGRIPQNQLEFHFRSQTWRTT